MQRFWRDFLLCASDYKVPITVTEFCTNLYLCVSSLSTAKWQNIAGSKKITVAYGLCHDPSAVVPNKAIFCDLVGNKYYLILTTSFKNFR